MGLALSDGYASSPHCPQPRRRPFPWISFQRSGGTVIGYRCAQPGVAADSVAARLRKHRLGEVRGQLEGVALPPISEGVEDVPREGYEWVMDRHNH